MDGDRNAHAPGEAGGRLAWGEWLRQKRSLVPTIAVVTVVVAAVAATLVVTYGDGDESRRPPAVSKAGQDVVRAPPLVVKAPPLQAQGQSAAAPMASSALGAAPACGNCGVVESVKPVNRNSTFQMRIRMDDGTVRTVEQHGAVAAGSRVLLEGNSVRAMPAPPRQG